MTGEVSGQGAVVHAFLSLQGMITGVAVLMTGYLAARNSRALMTRPRNNSMDLTVIFICYTAGQGIVRSEEHTSELQSLMRISYAVFCFKKTQQRSCRH